MERGSIQALPKFFGYPLLSQEGVKLQISNFGGYIYRANPNKSPLKILEKGERGRNQGVPKIFRAPMYKAHCALIFAIAQLSCCISQRGRAGGGNMPIIGYTPLRDNNDVMKMMQLPW